MSETLQRIKTLVLAGDYLISSHGFNEMDKDGILVVDVIAGIPAAFAIEDYPDRARGPSVLTLQHDAGGHPVHVV
jgi:hypothetical protein